MSIYTDLGLSKVDTSSTGKVSNSEHKTSLNQEDFLSLLTTELSNQDPTNPADSTQMMSQMSQLSMVQSLAELNQTASSLSSSVTSSTALMASSLVGQDVQLRSSTGYFNGGESSQFVIKADSGVSNMILTITDQSGAIVNKIDLGDGSGDINLFWDGTDSNGNIVKSGNYTYSVNGLVDGTNTSIPVYAYGRVASVTLGNSVSDAKLNIEGGGTMNMSEVRNVG
ncbi:MAG: flagellar hook assembly protein FlgD [Succinivibrionaceae bacterium]